MNRRRLAAKQIRLESDRALITRGLIRVIVQRLAETITLSDLQAAMGHERDKDAEYLRLVLNQHGLLTVIQIV